METQTLSIIVTIKNVYGNEQIYPACEKAHFFADIAGTKTLTSKTIKSIKDLGYKVQVQDPRFKTIIGEL